MNRNVFYTEILRSHSPLGLGYLA